MGIAKFEVLDKHPHISLFPSTQALEGPTISIHRRSRLLVQILDTTTQKPEFSHSYRTMAFSGALVRPFRPLYTDSLSHFLLSHVPHPLHTTGM